MIALVVFTDGRYDLLERTLASAEEHLHGPIVERVIVNDCDPELDAAGVRHDHALLRAKYAPDYRIVSWVKRLGFAGTIEAAWRALAASPQASSGEDVEYVFHLEDDFVLHRDVDLEAMAAVLRQRPGLVQLALRRQPWNDEERAAGGIVEQHPGEYREVTTRIPPLAWQTSSSVVHLLEHRLFFTTNPSLYRRSLCSVGWPVVDRSEGIFTQTLLEDPGVRFGFWGARDSGEWCEHIGAQRVGTGY